MKNYIAFLVCFGMSFNLFCQDSDLNLNDKNQEMITDRPDATESPNTVPIKSFQIETGGLYERNNDQDIKTDLIVFNNSLIRYGVFKNFELRLAWAISEIREGNSHQNLDLVASGFSPLILGAKVAITEEKGLLPDIGLMVHITLPFLASKDYKPETTSVSFRFAFAHTINKKSSFSYNLGAQWADDSLEAAYVYSLAYAYGITEKLGVYVEVYGNFPENSRANHSCDTGLTYLIKNNFQLDATVGTGLTGNQDLLLGAGFSYRFPN